ncbi:acetyl-CoA acyltransferase [Prauserella aidingensis]|uniref:thiolase family protein n=1 Tax=Prauserella aidingensis TaxID=387890 RepID=UPI0020A2E2D2|nr:thiolase family protein [Prauserella aidingensis]MCP2255996.1 acetyl-CoA acyltransferase [Prauserella aidingensis]
MSARDAVIVGAVRTPVGVGKSGKGDLDDIHPVDLSAHVIRALVERTSVDPHEIEDVVWGCVSQVGEQAFNVARNSALAAGLPESVVGTTVDRQCGSSMQSLQFAAASLVAGHYDLAIAGGVEVMSRVPMFSNVGEADAFGSMNDRYEDRLVPQGISAELIADKWGLSRTYLDDLAVASHERAGAAQDAGLFAEEIAAVPSPDGLVERDQGIRPGTTVEKLATLTTPFKEDGVVTAGNASQISDGSAALLVTTSAKAAELGLTPLARLHSFATAGVDPIMMLTGPIPATAKILERSGLALSDMGAFEVNEAFASVLGAWYAETGADPSLTNPLGGAMALGHPLGASGARIATTLVHHMRRERVRYALQTMCEGGGMANATIFELL